MTQIPVPEGLKDVIVAETKIGDVRGEEGFYHYGRYDATWLARTKTFEEACFLVLHGELPEDSELAKFKESIVAHQSIPNDFFSTMESLAQFKTGTHPLTSLKIGLLLLSSLENEAFTWGQSFEQTRENCLKVIARTPIILAAIHRLSQGKDPLHPVKGKSSAYNWLYMVTGEEPSAEHEKAIDSYLTLTIDHGFNASTFTARVATSAGADVTSSVVAALGTFAGPLHGGAPDRALDSLDAIKEHGDARSWVEEQVSKGERMMGFGHAVYRTEDPRAALLRDIALRFDADLPKYAHECETAILQTLARIKPNNSINVNVEYWAGVTMELCGLPRTMFTPTFAVSRVVGWSAQVLEQSTRRKIIRPAAKYIGPAPTRQM